MRIGALLVLSLVAVSCGSSLEREYEEGAMTPFARATLNAPVVQEETDNGTDPKMEEVERALERMAAEWRARARPNPGRPAALGFTLASSVEPSDLKRGLSPDVVFAAAFSMSPAISASREALKATVEQFNQVAYLDAILRQYNAFTKDLNLRIGAPRQKQMVERFFPFPGTMSLKSRIVDEDARAAGERLAQTIRSTLTAAGQAYYDYAFSEEAIRIVGENVELLKGIVDIAEAKYGVGKAKQAVVLKTHVEIAALQNRLVTLRERRSTVRAKLNSIFGLTADFPLGPPEAHPAVPPPANPGPLYPLAREERQETAALRAKIRRTEALIELAETKAYPGLTFSEKPRQRPKFWFGETASFIQEMRTRLEGMKAQLAQLDARVEFEVKNAWFKWDAAWRQVALYKNSLLPQAEQAYEILESGWTEGITDFLDALDAQRTWLRFRLEHRSAVRETNRERLALIDSLGTKIPGGDDGK